MTAWGVVAACGIGGGVAGPFLDALARRVRRATPAASEPAIASSAPGAGCAGPSAAMVPVPAVAFASTPAPGPTGFPATSGEALPAEAAAAALVTGLGCALAAVRLGAVPELTAYCALFGALVTVSITDLRTGLVPRRVVYPASVLVAVALVAASAADSHWRPLLDALVGGAVAFGVLGAVWWIAPKAMGLGDVRLAGLCGAALGWLGFAPLYLGFLAAFVAGAGMGVGVLVVRGRRRFPFAPALAFGTMFGVLWGAWLGDLWLHPHPL